MDLVDEQLQNSKTIAVVGLSGNPDRISYRVTRYMQEQGYRIIPVNPMIEEVLGRRVTLTSSQSQIQSIWSTYSGVLNWWRRWWSRPSRLA